jgi:hypothetical protein
MVIFKIGNAFCHKIVTVIGIKTTKYTRFLNQNENKSRLSFKYKKNNKKNTCVNQESNEVLLQGKTIKQSYDKKTY